MADTLEKLKVIIEASASPMEKEAKRVISTTQNMVKSVNQTLQGISKNQVQMVDDKTMSQLQNMRNLIRRTFTDVKSGDFTRNLAQGMTLCGLPVPKKAKTFILKFLDDMTDELPRAVKEKIHKTATDDYTYNQTHGAEGE